MAVSPSTVNPDTYTLYLNLPQFVQDQDQANGYPFLAWLDGGGGLLQTLDNLCRDDSLGNPGWSILLDVTRCPAAMLPWLAQFVGVRFSAIQITDAQQRAAIETPAGFARGTVAAIKAAAAPLLSSGTVKILERTPDPYSYTVEIPSAGITGGTWGALATSYTTWTAVVGAYATWALVDAQSTAIASALAAVNPGGLIQTLTYV